MDEPRSELLVFHQDRDFKIAREWRSPWFKGPQDACHPEHLEICLVESGVGYLTLESDHAAHGAGSYGLVAPGVVHSSWTERERVQECVLHLPVAHLAQTASALGVRDYRQWPRGFFPITPAMSAVVQSLRQELLAPEGAGRELLISSAFTQLAVILLRAHHVHRVHSLPALGSSHLARLDRVEELLQADLTAAHRLEDLALHAEMSPFHFSRSFKKRFGTSPHAYVLGLRLERARELMLATELSLVEIAFEVGFGSGSRLTEAHQKRYGQTPSAWREGARASFGRT